MNPVNKILGHKHCEYCGAAEGNWKLYDEAEGYSKNVCRRCHSRHSK